LGTARQSTPSGGHLAPSVLLKLMPMAAAVGFIIMLIAWIITLRKSRSVTPS
jgi:hypothetical protein